MPEQLETNLQRRSRAVFTVNPSYISSLLDSCVTGEATSTYNIVSGRITRLDVEHLGYNGEVSDVQDYVPYRSLYVNFNRIYNRLGIKLDTCSPTSDFDTTIGITGLGRPRLEVVASDYPPVEFLDTTTKLGYLGTHKDVLPVPKDEPLQLTRKTQSGIFIGYITLAAVEEAPYPHSEPPALMF